MKKLKTKLWSNFENTCFHIKYFVKYLKIPFLILVKPLSINLYGVREWSNIYPLVEIVRIPEALDYYSKGLNFFQYIYEKLFFKKFF